MQGFFTMVFLFFKLGNPLTAGIILPNTNYYRQLKKLVEQLARAYMKLISLAAISPLSANFTKCPNTLKQFVGKLPTNCLSVFDHFVGLALKGLIPKLNPSINIGLKIIVVDVYLLLSQYLLVQSQQ